MIFDLETDGLLDEATKIHCLSYTTDGENVTTYTDYEDMRWVLTFYQDLIGHNIIRFDIPVLERILNINLSGKLKIDTLALSWYLDPRRSKHGLDSYGHESGLLKKRVEDHQWKEGDIGLMVERCEQDVRINHWLWMQQKKKLEALYG